MNTETVIELEAGEKIDAQNAALSETGVPCTNDPIIQAVEMEKDLRIVQPGQIWADNDRRRQTRQVKVTSVEIEWAKCRDMASGRSTRIALRRFRPVHNGYRWISDPQPA